MKRKKLFFIFIVIIIVTFELILRLFYEDRLRVWQMPLCYEPDSLIGYKYIPNSIAKVKRPGINNKLRINNHGFYGLDFNERKKKGVYRICIIGSSLSNALWTDGDNDYVIFLQQLFTEDSLKNIEVINCAIDGGRRFLQEINLAKQVQKKYEPNLILFAGINSDTKWRFYSRKNYRGYQLRYSPFSNKAESISKAKVDEMFSPKFRLIEKVYNSSYIVRFVFRGIHYDENKTSGLNYDLRTLLEKEDNTENRIVYYFSLEAFEKELTDLNSELQRKGTKLVLLEFGFNEQMRLMAENNQLEMLSLGLNLVEYKMKYDGHPTQKGHFVIAQKLYTFLLENNIIPSEYLN